MSDRIIYEHIIRELIARCQMHDILPTTHDELLQELSEITDVNVNYLEMII